MNATHKQGRTTNKSGASTTLYEPAFKRKEVSFPTTTHWLASYCAVAAGQQGGCLFNSPGATTAQPFPGRACCPDTHWHLQSWRQAPQAYGAWGKEDEEVLRQLSQPGVESADLLGCFKGCIFSNIKVRDGETHVGANPPNPLPSKCVYVDSWQLQRTSQCLHKLRYWKTW